MPAADGAIIVLTIANEADFQFPPDNPKDEPPLKNIQPTHKIRVPRATLLGFEAAKPLSFSVVP